jgi:hypothetical protein
MQWARTLQHEIHNHRVARLDELFTTYCVAKAVRVQVFGEKLQLIMRELDTRDLKTVPTGMLLRLALLYGELLRAESEPLELQGTPEVDIGNIGVATTTPTWPA